MADLTIHATWLCPTNIDWHTTVSGSNGASYTVRFGRLYGRDLQVQGCDYGYTCTCPSFTKSKKAHLPCKHIKAIEASKARCAWNWEMEVGVVEDRNASGEPVCPCCGERLAAVNVAV